MELFPNEPPWAAAIFRNLGLPANHAIYFPNFVNCEGLWMNGDKSEVFTFSYKPQRWYLLDAGKCW